MTTSYLLDQIQQWLITYSFRIAISLLVVLIGWIVIRKIVKLIKSLLTKRHLDPSLTTFLLSLTSISLKLLLIITALSILGVPMASFIALLGALGLAIGLALQGSLSNFAGGVLILFFKPYEVGHLVNIGAYTGEVKEIEIFNTILVTDQGETVLIPNSTASNTEITNFSKLGERRLDLNFKLAYSADLQEAKKAISEACKNIPTIHKDQEVEVAVINIGDKAITIQVRVWVKPSDYSNTSDQIIEKVKISFDKYGVELN